MSFHDASRPETKEQVGQGPQRPKPSPTARQDDHYRHGHPPEVFIGTHSEVAADFERIRMMCPALDRNSILAWHRLGTQILPHARQHGRRLIVEWARRIGITDADLYAATMLAYQTTEDELTRDLTTAVAQGVRLQWAHMKTLTAVTPDTRRHLLDRVLRRERAPSSFAREIAKIKRKAGLTRTSVAERPLPRGTKFLVEDMDRCADRAIFAVRSARELDRLLRAEPDEFDARRLDILRRIHARYVDAARIMGYAVDVLESLLACGEAVVARREGAAAGSAKPGAQQPPIQPIQDPRS